MKKHLLATLTLIATLSITKTTLACTDFKINAQDGTVMIARTLEFAQDLKSNLRTSTRNRIFTEVAPDGKPAMNWKAKYGYLFLDGMNIDIAMDGMNEEGLSIEALYLPGMTQYQTIPANQNAHAIPYFRFCDWVLSQFKTVTEVRQALANTYVYAQTLPGLGAMIFPLHFSITDMSGQSIVVEFIAGKMNIYDNAVNVMTNAPTFDWQVTNLRNYVNLSPVTPHPVVVDGLAFPATGQGSGMKGLPGDVSPPSRFVKAYVMKAAIFPAKTASDALNIAEHMINNFDIPAGFVRANEGGKVEIETTQWTIFKDLKNKMLYYKTYGDTTLHVVAMSQLNFAENAQRLKMPIADHQFILDMTKQFLEQK